MCKVKCNTECILYTLLIVQDNPTMCKVEGESDISRKLYYNIPKTFGQYHITIFSFLWKKMF